MTDPTYRSVTSSGGIAAIFVCMLLLASSPPASTAGAEPIIINHACAELETIPAEWIAAAKDQLRVSYGHTSHGSQPIDGMEVLMNAIPDVYDFNTDGAVTAGVLSIADRTPAFDLGWGSCDWDNRTRDYLDDEGGDRNVVIWSWCGQVSDADQAYIDSYLSKMAQLEVEYPDVVFVYMTGHLDGTGEAGNLNVRNNQIRDYCVANDKVLFDFAEIESYDPDGSYFLDQGADDACDYDGGNWAEEWCAAHPGSPLCLECDICAHSESLNCNIKARAFWWMFARIAGWQSQSDTTPPAVPQSVAAAQLP